MKQVSYWHDTAPAFAQSRPVEHGTRADLIVIGAGFTGLSAARTAARRGLHVQVFEAGHVVNEASGQNGGHCNNGLSHDFSGVASVVGIERAREMYRAFDAGVDLVEEIVNTENIDCHFRRSGKLKLAARPEHFDKMRRAQEVLAREVDPDTAIVERGDLRTEIASDRYFGGLLQRRSAQMHMGKFGVGLANAAARAGAIIHEHAPVTAIERKTGGFRVSTAQGSVDTDEVLIATGASQTGPFSWFRRRIVPVGSFLIVTEPLGEEVARALMPGHRNCTTTQNIGNYFRLTADYRLVFGGRARFAMSGQKSDLKSGGILQRQLKEVFPQVTGRRIDYCWGGLVDMTRDRLPRAGSLNGMHFALGYSGHGVQMSTYMGDVMARLILRDDVSNPWRDMPWSAVPLHFGKPWFLPFVGAYYRIMDAIK